MTLLKECSLSPHGKHQIDCPVGEKILKCQYCGKEVRLK